MKKFDQLEEKPLKILKCSFAILGYVPQKGEQDLNNVFEPREIG